MEKLDSAIIVKKTRKEKSLRLPRPNLYASSSSELSAFSQNSNSHSSRASKQTSESNNISGPSQEFLMNQDSNASEKSHSSDSSKHSATKIAKKSKKEKDALPTSVKRSPPKAKSSAVDSQSLPSKFVTPSQMNDLITSQPKVSTTSLTNRIQEAPDSHRIRDEVNASKQPKRKETEKELSRVRSLSSSDSDSCSADSDSSSWSSDNEQEIVIKGGAGVNEGTPRSNKLPSSQISSKGPASFDLRDDLQLSDSD